jgi:lysophospholipase L1-like esterase
MKKQILIILGIAVGLHLVFMCKAQATYDSSYNNSHYLSRMEFFEHVPKRKNEVVFLGNSITEAGKWNDLLPGGNCINRGISGDVTFGIIARMDKTLAFKPKKVFLLIGVNDLKRGIPQEVIVHNYRTIIEQIKLKSPKTKLYIQSVLPVNESLRIEAFSKVNNIDIVSLNQKLCELALEYGLSYVNLWEVLADNNGQLHASFTSDGVHLKPVAYISWAEYLKQKGYL